MSRIIGGSGFRVVPAVQPETTPLAPKCLVVSIKDLRAARARRLGQSRPRGVA